MDSIQNNAVKVDDKSDSISAVESISISNFDDYDHFQHPKIYSGSQNRTRLIGYELWFLSAKLIQNNG